MAHLPIVRHIMTKRVGKLTFGMVIAVTLIIAGANYFQLQRPMGLVCDEDPRNEGIKVFVHYRYFVDPTVVVYDLRAVSEKSSPMDVTRVLLQFAVRQKEKSVTAVELAYKGQEKFRIQGEYFKTLGNEYGTQNPMYTIRTLPENLYKPDGKQAFGNWTGGMLGVLGRQMQDFTEWHRAWYINDLATSRKEQ